MRKIARKRRTLEAPGRESLVERILLNTEALLGLRLTLHDPGGRFHDADGNPLFGARRASHRRFIVCASTAKQSCIAHCLHDVEFLAAKSDAPFVHECHSRLREIVVPLKRDGILMGVLFVGAWRAAGNPPAHLPPEAAKAFMELGELDAAAVARTGSVLSALGEGLLSILASLQERRQGEIGSRKGEMLRFIRTHAGEKLSLKRLAKALNLSPARACHLVKETFGKPLGELLAEERVSRAKTLLLSTDMTVREIAMRVGMPDQYHFNRTFKRRVGVPPGGFRRGRGAPEHAAWSS